MHGFSKCIVLVSLLLVGCSTASGLPDDPFAGKARALSIVLVNHTDRYVSQAFVDKYWAANMGKRYPDGSPRGGYSSVCCYSGVTDWRKPVRVMWEWGREEEPGVGNKNGTYTPGKLILPDEEHVVMAKLPPRFPVDSPDMFKQETSLCVIFRDLNTVELDYAVGSVACAKK
ncbi:DUF3304 domain-containing protein [Chromobacterium sphagni]|uniref:DUF3304 domain-containing protein n=1 Tax=Chromobacterium sphagni TaxID=1903179 RepID=UPI0009F37F2D|nr:DUF3304 domain-containing protein [Chromobacterium sphagni]